jgi:RNA polymerase sigma-70 factor (ECF subfamily)
MSGTPDEREAFSAFKSSPTSDSLIRLLRAHQERVYRLSLQVLRRAHDAEDVAQEVLIRIVEGVRKIDDADAFRRWVYRVSLNAALEAARKASRRRTHESRAAMKDPPGEPLDEASRGALFEAIARLDDGPRSLLLDHYFEGETVEALGSRDGVSAQAVSKRLERAREDLRRALPASALGAFDLGRLFERGISAPAVPDLLTGAVLAKVHSVAAALVAGGVAMTTKSVLAPFAIAALLLLCVGAGVVILFKDRSADLRGAYSAAKRGLADAPPVGPAPVVGGDAATGGRPRPSPDSSGEAGPSATSPLGARLDRFRKWWVAIQAEKKALAKDDHEAYVAFSKRWDRELWEQVSGLKELILEDPEGFLAFLRDRNNESVIGDLTRMGLLTQTDRPHVHFMRPFTEFPQSLTRGLLQLLQSGSNAQKTASLNLLGELPDVPQEYKNVYLTLLDDPDPELQRQVIGRIVQHLPMTPALFSKLTALGTNSENLFIRLAVVSSIAGMQGAESEAFVLNRLTVAANDNELKQITFSLDMRYQAARRAGRPIQEDQLARAVAEAMARNHPGYLHWLMPVATHLSGPRLKPILLQAMAKTQDETYRDRLGKAVERIDQGSCTRDDLMKILDPWK